MIRSAEPDDIDALMEFIDKEWRKNHILARDKDFFRYMYVLNGNVHFAISVDESNNIDGILGYIPYDKECKQISLTVWKALKSTNGMIGMSLLKYICDTLRPDMIASPGVNPKTTTAIYKFFKYEVDKMKHFYRLASCKEFKIADVLNYDILPTMDAGGNVRELTDFNDYISAGIVFQKNALQKEDWYIKQRYFEHPVYKYRHFLVSKEKERPLLIICREQKINNSTCIRVVDMLGNYQILPCFTRWMDNEMALSKYEYIDCYVAGISAELFLDSGWNDVEISSNVIPNYFDPYERRNIDIYFSSKPAGIVLFRGDGDQDRPN